MRKFLTPCFPVSETTEITTVTQAFWLERGDSMPQLITGPVVRLRESLKLEPGMWTLAVSVREDGSATALAYQA